MAFITSLLDLLWKAIADLIVLIAGDMDKVQLQIIVWVIVGFSLFLWLLSRIFRDAVKGAKGAGAFEAYKEVAMKGVVVQPNSSTILFAALLTMIVTALVIFMLFGTIQIAP